MTDFRYRNETWANLFIYETKRNQGLISYETKITIFGPPNPETFSPWLTKFSLYLLELSVATFHLEQFLLRFFELFEDQRRSVVAQDRRVALVAVRRKVFFQGQHLGTRKYSNVESNNVDTKKYNLIMSTLRISTLNMSNVKFNNVDIKYVECQKY